MEALKILIEYGIIGLLGLMSVMAVAVALERFRFFRGLRLEAFADRRLLELALTRRLHLIATVGSNAPYVRSCFRMEREFPSSPCVPENGEAILVVGIMATLAETRRGGNVGWLLRSTSKARRYSAKKGGGVPLRSTCRTDVSFRLPTLCASRQSSPKKSDFVRKNWTQSGKIGLSPEKSDSVRKSRTQSGKTRLRIAIACKERTELGISRFPEE